MGRGPQTSKVGEESPRDQVERGRGLEVEVGHDRHIKRASVTSLLASQPELLGPFDYKGPEPMPAPAQRFVWAARQPLGNAALGALFA